MKKLILLSAFLVALLSTLSAQIITVDNNANSPADYTDLQDAIDAASAGDTIYVAGSDDTYGDVDLNKELTLIGAGVAFEDPSQVTTQIGNLDFINTDASNSEIVSIRVGSFSYVEGVSDLVISKCRFTSMNVPSSANNWIIENCLVGGGTINGSTATPYPTNIFIQNNIFGSTSTNGGGGLRFFRSSSVYILNNLFIGANQAPLDQLQNSVIENNIFFYSSGVSGGNLGTTKNESLIRNNIATVTCGFFDGPGDDGTNQVVSLEFINYTGSFSSFTIDSNFGLVDGSPGLTASKSNGEIGIYGGLSPFTQGINSAFPSDPATSLPLIEELSVTERSVPKDGTITINLKAKISN